MLSDVLTIIRNPAQQDFNASMSGKGNCHDNAAVEMFFNHHSRDIAAQYTALQCKAELI
jgi:transposase InsO family protein